MNLPHDRDHLWWGWWRRARRRDEDRRCPRPLVKIVLAENRPVGSARALRALVVELAVPRGVGARADAVFGRACRAEAVLLSHIVCELGLLKVGVRWDGYAAIGWWTTSTTSTAPSAATATSTAASPSFALIAADAVATVPFLEN